MKSRALICYHFDAATAGGGLQYSIDTARFWLKKGYQVHVLTSTHPRKLLDLEPFVQQNQLILHEVSDMNRLLLTHDYNPEVYARAAEVVKSVQPELIEVHNFHGLLGAIWAAVEFCPKVVYCALDFGLLCMNWCLYDGTPVPCSGPEPEKCKHCMLSHYQPPMLKQIMARFPTSILKHLVKNPAYFKQNALVRDYFEHAGDHLQRMLPLLKRFYKVVTMSPIVGEILVQFGVPKDRLIIQTFGLPYKRLNQDNSMTPPWTTLAYLGHMGPTKGFSVIEKAVRMLPAGLPLKIHIYGPEAIRHIEQSDSHLKSYIKAFVTLIGDENEQAILNSDAVLVPSQWHENSPYVVLRALAVGRPVIASRHAGIAHLLHEGENGFLVDPANARAWADILKRVAENPTVLRELRPFCSYAKTAEDYGEEIENLLMAGL